MAAGRQKVAAGPRKNMAVPPTRLSVRSKMSEFRGRKDVAEDYEGVLVDFLLSERIPNLRMIIQDEDKEKNFAIAAEYMPLKDAYSMQVREASKDCSVKVNYGYWLVNVGLGTVWVVD